MSNQTYCTYFRAFAHLEVSYVDRRVIKLLTTIIYAKCNPPRKTEFMMKVPQIQVLPRLAHWGEICQTCINNIRTQTLSWFPSIQDPTLGGDTGETTEVAVRVRFDEDRDFEPPQGRLEVIEVIKSSVAAMSGREMSGYACQ